MPTWSLRLGRNLLDRDSVSSSLDQHNSAEHDVRRVRCPRVVTRARLCCPWKKSRSPMAAAPPTAPQQIKSADKSAAGDPAWGRLVDQLAWYDRKSTGAQQSYKRLKMLE